MLVTAVAVVLAIVIIAVIVVIDRRRPASTGPTPRPGLAAWSSFGFGLVSFLALVVPLIASQVGQPGDEEEVTASNVLALPLASISFSIVGLALGIYSLKRRDRHWPVWVGLVSGGLTVAFWLFFFIADIAAGA